MPSAMLDIDSTLRVDNLFNVDGLVAVITGGGTGPHSFMSHRAVASFPKSPWPLLTRLYASPGIGKMMTTALAENGAHKIYIVGRREEPLNELAAKFPKYVSQIPSSPPSLRFLLDLLMQCATHISITRLTIDAVVYSTVIPMRGDITSKSDLGSIASRIRSEVGYINVLIANAGMTGPMLKDLKPRHTLSDFVEHAWNTPMHEFSDTYNLNCTALYYTVLAFLELLDEGNKSRYQGGKSQVIATASTASFLRDPRAGYAYLSSKAAVISLIKCFATFCVPWGIRFNAFAAGCMFTLTILLSRSSWC